MLLKLVHLGEAVEHAAAQGAVDAGGIGEEENGVGAAAELHALMAGREEAAPPEAVEESLVGVGAGAVRDHDEERDDRPL